MSTWLRFNQSTISFWLGLFTIVLGLAFIGLVPWLQRLQMLLTLDNLAVHRS